MPETNRAPKLFNTPIEVGLRTLVLLNCVSQQSVDIDKLMYFDYLSLNTEDFNGPSSLHAPVPHRGVQVYARKELMQKGLALLISKELVSFSPTPGGFAYQVTPADALFLQYFQSKYFIDYVDRARWVIDRFADHTTDDLKSYINQRIQHWNSEFLSEDQMTNNL